MIDLTIELRNLELSDYSKVSALYKTVIEEYLNFLRNRGIHEIISDVLEFDDFKFYVASQSSFGALTERNSLVGFILAREIEWINFRKKTLWLEFIAVDSNYRKHSIGLKLLEEEKKYAREHSIDSLCTTLNIDIDPFKRLLIKAGFTVKDWRIAILNSGFATDN